MFYNRDFGNLSRKIEVMVKENMPVEQRLPVITDILWEGLKDQGLAWVGFYKIAEDEKEMLLEIGRASCRERV